MKLIGYLRTAFFVGRKNEAKTKSALRPRRARESLQVSVDLRRIAKSDVQTPGDVIVPRRRIANNEQPVSDSVSQCGPHAKTYPPSPQPGR
jgi:hypothetical protein